MRSYCKDVLGKTRWKEDRHTQLADALFLTAVTKHLKILEMQTEGPSYLNDEARNADECGPSNVENPNAL